MRVPLLVLLCAACLPLACGGSEEPQSPQPRTVADASNPQGFVKNQLCQAEREEEYNAAGFTCQASGAESCIYTDYGTTCIPIMSLFVLNEDGTVGATTASRDVPTEAAATKILGTLRRRGDDEYRGTCRRRSSGVVSCTFRGVGALASCMATGAARRRGGALVAERSAVSGCGARERSPRLATQAQEPQSADMTGTYVCLTGILAQVRPAGPTEIAPLDVPATGIEPPLKVDLRADGTYSNITFGKAYVDDPLWEGTWTVDGEVVRLFSPPDGRMMTSYPFLHRTDAEGTHYLIEDAPENDRYRAYACRRIAR